MSRDFLEELLDYSERFDSKGVSAEAQSHVRDAIADTLGCIVLGSREPLAGPLCNALFGSSSAQNALRGLHTETLSSASTASLESYALMLGAFAHAADYDDISHPAYCHPTAAILPALMLVGAIENRTGADLMDAYLLGLETLGQLGRRLNPGHYYKGWHATATFGALGATAALAHLMRLPRDATATAIGIAASMASGLQANFGSMTKPMHAGLPGRTAILACRLARSGFTSSANALEGKRGYFEAYAGTDQTLTAKAWGIPHEADTEFGLAIKAYPSCAATHAAIDAALQLREVDTFDAVQEIYVGMSRFATQPLAYDWPDTPLQAKFCMRYCVAVALLDGKVTTTSFSPEALRRDRLRELMTLVRVAVDERVAEDPEFAAVVEIRRRDGSTTECRVNVASGKAHNWLTREARRTKFMDCIGGTEERTDPPLFAMCELLDSSVRIRDLLALLKQAMLQNLGET